MNDHGKTCDGCLMLTVLAERDAARAERDALHAENQRLREALIAGDTDPVAFDELLDERDRMAAERDALRDATWKWRECDCWEDCHCKDLHALLLSEAGEPQ